MILSDIIVKKGEIQMSDIKRQIQEDLSEYCEKYPNIKNIQKPEWAFNFWILDKLFSEDENLIEEKIVDYNDKGIDCYVWHEDLHDLYLIQNKYFSEGTTLSNDYIQNDFLTRAIGALEKGTYTRCPELQKIYNQFCLEDDFTVHFHLYVTNNDCKTQTIMDGIAKYNATNKNKIAHIYSLDDIEKLYFQSPITDKKSMTYEIRTINKGTILNVNTDAYKMTQAIDAKYVLVPVYNLYQMYQKAIKTNYPIFDANIREYLGATGSVNKRIMETLKDPKDRINFFYYNNGITIIADDISSVVTQGGLATFTVKNPQIVNGCQTVSTIHETLSSLPASTLEQEFKDTYVMLKVLKIPGNDDSMKKLYQDIVTYNNSQNAINQKTFVASSNEFKRVQDEFERKGFLVCIKQSDKHQFSVKYKVPTPLINANNEIIKKFGIKNLSKTKDFYIDLEKFLQVILAYVSTTRDAIQNKSRLLKVNSEQNKAVVDFIKNPDVTINAMLDLYLLYLRAEQEKKASDDGKMPIPLYLIHCFAHYDCKDNATKICDLLKSEDDVNRIIKLYKATISGYYLEWKNVNDNKDYNTMIKSVMDYSLMDKQRTIFEALLKNM